MEKTFGEAQLVAMTAAGERGILCQMQIEPESRLHLRALPSGKATAIQATLEPLLEETPAPTFTLRWDDKILAWRSEFAIPWELPPELRELFKETGYGSLTVKTNVGVIHVCHAADEDIEGFRGKPVLSRWQLVEMPTAPLIRLELTILDDPANPFRFEPSSMRPRRTRRPSWPSWPTRSTRPSTVTTSTTVTPKSSNIGKSSGRCWTRWWPGPSVI